MCGKAQSPVYYEDEPYETREATAESTVKIKSGVAVSFSPGMIGLDRTDAGAANKPGNATAKLACGHTDSFFTWPADTGACEIPEGNPNTGQGLASVTYQTKDKESCSGKYEDQEISVTATPGGNATTNFTVVKVDVTIDGVGEDKEETEGALIAVSNAFVSVSIQCFPDDISGKVLISGSSSFLYELEGNDQYKKAQSSYTASELKTKQFCLRKWTTESKKVKDQTIVVTHDESGAIDKACFTVYDLKLAEVTFGGTSQFNLRSDDGILTYSGPHWKDANLDGDADDPGDRKYPVGFVRNTKMKVSAKWKIKPALANTSVKVSGSGSGNISFPETSLVVNGNEIVLTDMEASDPLADTVDFHDPLTINWSVDIEGFPGGNAGKSENQVYVTWGKPLVTTVYHTLAHLGCKHAKGKSAIGATVDGVYSAFTGLNVRRVSDGTQMTYWVGNKGGGIQETDQILKASDGNGNCQAWSALLRDCFKVQGIPADRIRVSPIAPDTGVLVKNWTFNAPSLSGAYPYKIDKDALSDSHRPAQGNAKSPDSFTGHWITRCNGDYFDPSYGSPKIIEGVDKDKRYENTTFSGYFKWAGLLQLSRIGRKNDTSPNSASEVSCMINN